MIYYLLYDLFGMRHLQCQKLQHQDKEGIDNE